MATGDVPIRSIRNFRCRYHRNGCNGEGFFACSFLWRDGRNWIAMQAAVFSNDSGECDGRVAVMSHDVEECWRGDSFEASLRQLIETAGDSAFRPLPDVEVRQH